MIIDIVLYHRRTSETIDSPECYDAIIHAPINASRQKIPIPPMKMLSAFVQLLLKSPDVPFQRK